MKLIDMTCSKCGATMKADLDKGKVTCEYCGHLMLIEQEDTIEEIREKAQAKSYGYHRGRLRAEAEAENRAQTKKKLWKFLTPVIVIGSIVFFGVLVNLGQEVAKPKVNPFDCISVSFQGKDGKGELVLETNTMEGIDVNRIDYDISKNRNLYQGEAISIIAESDDYWLTETTKTYTVEGLDEYLKDLENIPDEALELVHLRAEDVLELNLKRTKTVGDFVDMKPVKLFLLTDGKQTNVLYDVFEVNFAWDGGETTLYVVACFSSVIVRDREQVSIDMSSGMFVGGLAQVRGSLYITAYDSVEDVKVSILTSQDSYMELKELDL